MPVKMEEKTYAQKLADPRWQRKRNQVLERDNYTCKLCGDNSNTLHVHHIAYNHGEPWEIDTRLLVTLCAPCHGKETEQIKSAFTLLINTLKKSGLMSRDVYRLSEVFDEVKIEEKKNANIFDIIFYLDNNPDLFKKCVNFIKKDLKELGDYLSEFNRERGN